MTALRWLASVVFVVALVTWLYFCDQASRRPESWVAARKRTAAFLAMGAAGVASISLSKPARQDEAETF